MISNMTSTFITSFPGFREAAIFLFLSSYVLSSIKSKYHKLFFCDIRTSLITKRFQIAGPVAARKQEKSEWGNPVNVRFSCWTNRSNLGIHYEEDMI